MTATEALLEYFREVGAIMARASGVPEDVLVDAPRAPLASRRQPTEADKALHRAIGAPSRERNAMGAAQWMDDGE